MGQITILREATNNVLEQAPVKMARDLQQLEHDARDAIAAAYGRSLSDEEWNATKYALLELGKLLRDWRKPAEKSAHIKTT